MNRQANKQENKISSWISKISSQQEQAGRTQTTMETNLARLTGTVVSIVKPQGGYNNKAPIRFRVYAAKAQKSYDCEVGFFCPIQERDAISAIVNMTPQGLILMSRPILSLPFDPDTIVSCFIKGTYGSKFTSGAAWELHRVFLDLAGGVQENVPALVDNKVTLWRKGHQPEELWDTYIKPAQRKKLCTWWHKNRIMRPLYMLGLNNKEIQEARSEPRELLQILQANPYRAVTIPINKCQEIVQQLGLELSEQDFECGHVLRKIYDTMTNRGFNAVPFHTLMMQYPKLPSLLNKLVTEYGVVFEHDCIYLDFAYKAEDGISKWISRILTRPQHCVDHLVAENKNLSDEQMSAVHLALTYPISIITGGPGTGKTTVINEIIKQQQKRGRKLEIASFTGKAVARIREVTDFRAAATMNQILTVASPDRKIDHLIVDETSMVPLELLHEFITRFEPQQVTLIGDKDQLEPVSWGAVFEQLLKCCPPIPIARLSKIYRTGSSGITDALAAIQAPVDEDDPPIHLEEGQNFNIYAGDVSSITTVLKMLASAGIDSSRVTTITPYNKDVSEINMVAQQVFDKGEPSVTDENNVKWRVGDRVMATENRYDISVMNGEEGRVTQVHGDCIHVQFGKNTHKFSLTIPTFSFDQEQEALTVKLLIHSYAITVHRSQGSEWDIIIFYIPESQANASFITKRLVYTALSRAKILAYCIGSINALNSGANKGSGFRCDNLAKRIVTNNDNKQ